MAVPARTIGGLPVRAGRHDRPTPDVYATATAWTALATPTPDPANATTLNGIPNSPAGKQLAWALQFLFSIDPTQLDPQDIAPRFTEEFLTALPVDRLAGR